jgi:arylsulfatase A-like enzyme
MDSFRADLLDSRAESWLPHLSRVGQRSAIFTQAYAQGPYTTVSIPSMLTGRYPNRLTPITIKGVTGVLPGNSPTLAPLLSAHGYRTLAFHSNPFLSAAFGYADGFDTFFDDLFLGHLQPSGPLALILRRVHRLARFAPCVPAAKLNRRIRQALHATPEPFFLWAHYMDTHGPYQPGGGFPPLAKLRSERLLRKSMRHPEQITAADKRELWDCYRERAHYLDEQLGYLLHSLGEQGLLENTLVIVTADHGDEFCEHGSYSHFHKLYDELIHVPLLICGPGLPPSRIDEIVELVQIFPTILEFLGIVAPGPLEGMSLLAAMHGDRSGLPGRSLSEADVAPSYHACLRNKDWKLIVNEEHGRTELYQLSQDPGEQHNVYADYPEVARDLWEHLKQLRDGPAKASGTVAVLSAGEEKLLEKRLEDLGYL